MSSASKLATLPASAPGYYLGDDLLTGQEVEAWLKMKPGWVSEQIRHRARVRSKDPMPFAKLGKYPRFSKLLVAEWVARNSS